MSVRIVWCSFTRQYGLSKYSTIVGVRRLQGIPVRRTVAVFEIAVPIDPYDGVHGYRCIFLVRISRSRRLHNVLYSVLDANLRETDSKKVLSYIFRTFTRMKDISWKSVSMSSN